MKRTTITTALLLVTVAGAALSGCVTVPSADTAPGVSVTPSARSAPGPDGRGEPLPVRSSAAKDAEDRAEADEDAKDKDKEKDGKDGGKGKGAKDAGTTSSDASAGKGGAGDRAGSDRHPGHRLFPPRGGQGGGPHAEDRPARPRKPGGGSVDACGIGTEYGGWGRGSAEEAMCRDLQHRATK
ncbi:hypothetical protein [Streptomyces sp. NPDC002644]